MTDAGAGLDSRAGGAPVSAGGLRRAPARALRRARRSHPLLEAFPLTVMTVATFLVLFAVMMTRMRSGADPAAHAAAAALVQTSPTGRPVRTRTSGGGVSVSAANPTGGAPTLGAAPAVVTRSSGAAPGGANDD